MQVLLPRVAKRGTGGLMQQTIPRQPQSAFHTHVSDELTVALPLCYWNCVA